MIAPRPTPTQTWIWGRINHFDFQASFIQQFPAVVHFYREKAFQDHLDLPYDGDAPGLRARWHEGHEPSVRFLSAQEDGMSAQAR
jgi:hypothetical protein